MCKICPKKQNAGNYFWTCVEYVYNLGAKGYFNIFLNFLLNLFTLDRAKLKLRIVLGQSP